MPNITVVSPFAQMSAFLGKKTDRPAPRGANTRIVRLSDHAIAVRLHSTNILTVLSDDSVVLYAAQYFTRTTFERMNDWMPSPYSVITDKAGNWVLLFENQARCRFVNNMVLNVRTGEVTYPPDTNLDAQDARNVATRKLIDRFMRSLVTPGDCESMMGESCYSGSHEDPAHLRYHLDAHDIEEPGAYPVYEIWVTAARARGYTSEGVRFWGSHPAQVRRVVKAYLLDMLIEGAVMRRSGAWL